MLVGVVSDTHGHAQNTRAAVRMLTALEVEQVIHCGDVGVGELVPLFKAWPTHFVFGNVDDPRELRRAIAAAGQTCHERFGSLTIGETRIAFLHGDDEALLEETIHSARYDLVCHGHTHVAREEWIGNTLVLNPGALYRTNRHSLAVVELPLLKVNNVAV